MHAVFLVLLVVIAVQAQQDNTLTFSVYVDTKGKGNTASPNAKVVTDTLDKVNANAYGTYNFNGSINGWNYLDIHANTAPVSSETHLSNMYAVGYAEGYVSCKEIRTFWPNFYKDLFGDLLTPPGEGTLKFIREQWKWMGEMIEEHADTDQYWYAQSQTRNQLEGLFAGYKQGCSTSHAGAGLEKAEGRPNVFWSTLDTPTLEHFLLINAWGDLYQITVKMKEPGQFSRLHGRDKQELVERCSAFVKLLPGNADVFFGHNTWDSFQSLGPRIFKKMNFPLWQTADPAATLVQYTTLFSSSPALLSSIDDFFVVKGVGHMGVQETTNSLYNLRLLSTIVPTTALSWQRSTAANQLSASGADWAVNFALYSSGTYTNQWMVIDFPLFTAGSLPKPGFFTVYEEVPNLSHTEDMTSTLIAQTFWSSYNSPFFPDIQEAAGYTALCQHGAIASCYTQAPRHIIFQEQQASVVDLASMQHIMRYNQWQTDAASGGDSCHSIACRGDLEPDAAHVGAFGALDAKISSVLLNVKTSEKTGEKEVQGDGCNSYAVLGPTYQNQPVFCWSTLSNEDSYSHLGQPDCFDFDWTAIPVK